MAIQGVLLMNMEPEIIVQINSGIMAAQFWVEIKRLYAGQSSADFTLVFSNLFNTRCTEEQDPIEHITKFKGYRRELILMGRDIPDDIFACYVSQCPQIGKLPLPASSNPIHPRKLNHASEMNTAIALPSPRMPLPFAPSTRKENPQEIS
jgi:hypothetical protein